MKQLQLVGAARLGSTFLPKLPDNVPVVEDIPIKSVDLAEIKKNMTTEFAPSLLLRPSESKKTPQTGGIPWNPRMSKKRR